MDFGRVSAQELTRINFKLPEPISFLKTQTAKPLTVKLGCPVWANPGFRGTIYPQETKKQDFLKNYALQFDAIELNSTHYSLPAFETIKKWNEEALGANPDFKFSPKLLQSISHQGSLTQHRQELGAFLKTLEYFGPSLGISFLQLPPFFSPAELPALFSFLDQWPQTFQLAIEFRHAAWFKNEAIAKKVSDYLFSRKISLVITDTPGERSVLHSWLTAPHMLVRFVANELHPVDQPRIQDWANHIHKLHTLGLEEIYFFAHQPDESLCLAPLQQLAYALKLQGIQVREPINHALTAKPAATQQLSLF